MYIECNETADMTKMIVGHEIWLGETQLNDDQAQMALFYGDNMRPDGSPDSKNLRSIIYRPDSRTTNPSILSERDRHILRFACEMDGCYTAIVDLAPVVFTQTRDGWHRGPKFQFKNVVQSRVIYQMAKRILHVGEGQSDQKETPHGILEIVPKKVDVLTGNVSDLRVSYEGKPLAKAELKAISDLEGRVMAQTKTDDQGWAKIPLTVKGDWMFKVAHMDHTKKVSEEYDVTIFITTLVMNAQ
jgi:uncharacterized GH25 family protein